MSSVLHPVGPEPERTYWIRRLLVVGLGLLLVIIATLVVLALSGRDTEPAGPVPASSSAPVSTVAPSSPLPQFTPSPEPPTPTSSPDATASARANPSASVQSPPSSPAGLGGATAR